MVAGSVLIGKNSWIAPSSSIKNGLKLGEGAFVGLGAVVIRDVESKGMVIGNPAKPLKKDT
jgi:UDP-3-O-[3-hydroxymyristoyl] glucosamine N-acyltransferase